MIRRNIIANYIGQAYVMGISIVVMPFYLDYLGPEAYGLVGFFIMMQVWLNILDAGFAPTFGRQVAEARGNNDKFDNLFKLLRSVEIIFFILSMIIVILIFLTTDWLSQEWIQSENLDISTIKYTIIIMGLIIALRWFSTVYRSGINGFEDQVWLNTMNIVINSFKYLGALFILIFISQDIKDFFNYQFAISILEVLILLNRMYSLLPSREKSYGIVIHYSSLKDILPFTMSIGYTTLLMTLLMQFDKLILSTALSLEEFGYYTIIMLVSTSLVSISTPIFLAMLPRMTMLLSMNKKDEMIMVYKKMTQLVTWVVFSSSVLICIYAEPILYILIGSLETLSWGADILRLYVLGYAFFVIASFQYYLQNSYGKLKYYVKGTTLLVFIQVPLMYISIINYGPIGSGITWLICNFIWFFSFTYFVHKKLLPDFHIRWLRKEISPILFIVGLLAYLIIQFIDLNLNDTRIILFFKVLLIGFLFLFLSSLSISLVREYISNNYIKLKNKIWS